MKALKPVSSCNLRLGNPPEFQPPLSLSPLVMRDFSRHLGGSFPVVRKREGRTVNATETSEQMGFTELLSFFFFFGGWGGRDEWCESYTPQESVTDQKSTWWMFIEEAQADISHCLSDLFVITFPSDTASYHGKLKTAQPWQQNIAHESVEQQ